MRTPEIGVRLALGAGRRDVVNMFVGQGLLLGAAGIAIGVPLAYAASQAMTALLFGVGPHDPWTYAGATVLAAAMIVAGSLRPAFRAASLDPAITIRGE
jgi:ABC-type antimicrobial peptide transport system permease subunit